MTDTITYSLIIVGALLVALAVLRLRHISVQSLLIGLMGAITGMLLGALASVPLSHIPGTAGGILPVGISAVLTIICIWVMISRRRQLLAALPWLRLDDKVSTAKESPAADDTTAGALLPRILVDTSVIIDGRIADIATAGFVPGRLVVPRFVLAELQNIADSDDAMRRGRGRRGLEVLGRLRDLAGVDVEVIEDDVPGIREVDAKLVALGQRFKCSVLTTDFNLNQVAQIQGVRVLNVNELSNAIRPVVLPGEELHVRVVQAGKERNQGVGYLADGTMIVVENGDKMIGQEVVTEVTRVFQTVAGKMIFAAPRGRQPHHQSAAQSAAIAQAPATPAPAAPSTAPKPTQQPPQTPAAPNGNSSQHRNRKSRDKRGPHQSSRQSAEDRLIAATNDQPDA